ncbi:SCO family protein [Mesorhizobium wenxiniae]|uniref:SCO family protein n=1 Tax=Mesorhizobium wenxiniae TaxID=2014805 RepID=A0A271KP46_9HYPH|nr:SCO family protein [Mesorhizobium wenxiniae]PAP97134.1 SCO family protein [Mesorhizobium wenxiniae]
MSRRHELLAPGLRAPISRFCIIFAAALLICPPVARTDTPVTVGGSFMLTAPDGTTVTDETYRGKWLLVFFGYTSCPDICPTTLSSIAAAIEELGPDAAKLQPLFITVDPERDTPEVMGSFTAAFDPRIVGLTGSPQQIAAVSKAYGAYGVARQGETGGDDYLMDHGTYIYIMNPQGQFVVGLDSDTPSSGIAARLGELVR